MKRTMRTKTNHSKERNETRICQENASKDKRQRDPSFFLLCTRHDLLDIDDTACADLHPLSNSPWQGTGYLPHRLPHHRHFRQIVQIVVSSVCSLPDNPASPAGAGLELRARVRRAFHAASQPSARAAKGRGLPSTRSALWLPWSTRRPRRAHA
jgi:hypothetical protein